MPDTDLDHEIRGGGGGGKGWLFRPLDKGGGSLQKKFFFFFFQSGLKIRQGDIRRPVPLGPFPGSDAATSGKQISRIFQRQIKLQFLRTEIYFKNRHSLTPFDHSGGLKP